MDNIDLSSYGTRSKKKEIMNSKIDSPKRKSIPKNGIRATGKNIKDNKNSNDSSKTKDATRKSMSDYENKTHKVDSKMSLRPKRTLLNFFSKKVEPESEEEPLPMKKRIKDESDDDYEAKPRRYVKEKKVMVKEETLENDKIEYANEHIEEALDKIPKNKKALKKLYEKLQERIFYYRSLFIKEQKELHSNFIISQYD